MIRRNLGVATLLVVIGIAVCPALLGQQAQRPLTNADVIKMVKGGVPESAIVASIRSGPGAFDLSNNARADLFEAGGKDHLREMTAIWDAMIAKSTNGRGGDQEGELTNATVIKMVKGGVPESAIVSTIRTASATKFDLSAAALIGLRKDGADQKVIDAMQASEKEEAARRGDKKTGKDSDDAKTLTAMARPKNAQKLTPEQSKAALMKLKEKKGRLSPMISNPKAAEADAPTIAVLMKQKQAFQSGKIMSATGDPAGGQSTPPGTPGGNPNPNNNPAGGTTPNNPNAGTSNPSPSNPSGGQKPVGALPSNPTGGSSKPTTPSAIAMTQAPVAIATTSNARAVSPAPVAIPSPPNSGSSSGNRMLLQQNASIDPCIMQGAPPVIKGLNAQEYNGPAVFSQDPLYNPFWIDGCHFGSVLGRAYVNAASGQKLADLIINSWTDTVIKATVDPSVIDVFDQDNVTLVIVPTSGQQGSKSGFKFYAMRREILLSSIPPGQVSVAKITDTGGHEVAGVYSSPYQGLGYSTAVQVRGGTPTPVDVSAYNSENQNSDIGMTAGTDRNAEFRFSGGTDVYDFSKLKPGFNVSRFQIDEKNIAICTNGLFSLSAGGETDYQDGSWNAQFYLAESKIRVDWAEEHCHVSDGTDSSNSTYALNVWVKGPAMSPQASPWQAGVK